MRKINSAEIAKLRRAAAKASGEAKVGESKKGKMAAYYVR